MQYLPIIIALVIFHPTSVISKPGEAKEKLRNEFTDALQNFLAEIAVGKKEEVKLSNNKTMELSFAKVANFLKAIQTEFLSKELLRECGIILDNHRTNQQHEANLSKLNAILPNSIANFWTFMGQKKADQNKSADKAEIDNQELHQLLTWLLSFAAQLGYTVGDLELNRETIDGKEMVKKSQHQIHLENFITALDCIAFSYNLYNPPITLDYYLMATILSEDRGNVSIEFVTKDEIEEHNTQYNINILFSYGRNMRSIQEIIQQIRAISLNELNNQSNAAMMKCWTTRKAESTNGIYALYQLKLYGYRLARRLLHSELLVAFFHMFPGAKRELSSSEKNLGKFLAKTTEKKEIKTVCTDDLDFWKRTQAMMHYEDAIQLQWDLKQIIDGHLKVIKRWQENLRNETGILKTIDEIANEIADFKELYSWSKNKGLSKALREFWSKFSKMTAKNDFQLIVVYQRSRAMNDVAKERIKQLWEKCKPDIDQLVSGLERLKILLGKCML